MSRRFLEILYNVKQILSNTFPRFTLKCAYRVSMVWFGVNRSGYLNVPCVIVGLIDDFYIGKILMYRP